VGRRLVPGSPWLPAVVYATALLPFAAANVVTTDTLLSFFETLAVSQFVLAGFESEPARQRARYVVM
jgi:4-amino-4-deoxy-L-arabinose transferase-like glycosyltransferase